MCRWLSGIPRTFNRWKTCPLLILRATLTQRYPEKPERLMWSSLEGKVECWETGLQRDVKITQILHAQFQGPSKREFKRSSQWLALPQIDSVPTSSQIIPKVFLFKSWKTFILPLHALPLVTLCICVRGPSHPAPAAVLPEVKLPVEVSLCSW